MVEALINELPKQSTLTGFLLVFVALLVALSFFLIRLLLAEKDKRFEDQKAINNALVSPIKEIQEASAENTRLLTQVSRDVEDIKDRRRR